MTRLLVCGINFEPEPTGTALITTWWSDIAASLGWTVTVVAGVPHYPAWRAAPVAARCHRGEIVTIHRPHYVPRRQTALHRAVYEASWVGSALPTVLRERFDATLGVVPSLGGAALAHIGASVRSVPCGLLFQDLVGPAARASGMPLGGRVARPVSSLELALARHAAGVAVPAEGLRRYLAEGGVRTEVLHVVRNPARLTRLRRPRRQVRARYRWNDDFVVLHSGSIGYKQGLETVLEAAAVAPRGIRFVLQGDGNQRDALERRARSLRLDNVEFLPVQPVDEFGDLLASADALLLNQRGSMRSVSMPSKLGSYFLAGVPIVAAVHPCDDVAVEVNRAGAGVVVAPDDPRALLGGISVLRDDPERARSLGAAGLRFAEDELSSEAASRAVAGFLEATFRAIA